MATVEEIEKRYGAILAENKVTFEPIYHAKGFAYPQWTILTAQNPTQFQIFNWGLVPRWVKSVDDAKEIRANTLNARVETLDEKPSFKYALQDAQRCLVPSTGFYEWQSAHKKKYPYFIYLPEYPIFSMAGLWETWQNPDDESDTWHTFGIITTDANALMAHIHNTKERMPLILSPDTEKDWLAGKADNTPIEEKYMKAHTVARWVGNQAENTNVRDAIAEVKYPELMQQQMTLF